VRVRSEGLFRRTTVSDGISEYKFYKPDCVVYRATSSFDAKVYLAVCGDHTPIAVAKNDELKITPDGLWGPTTYEKADSLDMTVERYIPIGRILNRARLARPYSSSEVPREGSFDRIDPTNARYPSVVTELNRDGQTALHYAVMNGCTNFLVDLLGKGVFPDLRDAEGKTPLMLSTETPFTDHIRGTFAEVLLQAGANVDAQSEDGMTALMYATRAGEGLMAYRFKQWRADTSLTNKAGETAGRIKASVVPDTSLRFDENSRDRCPE